MAWNSINFSLLIYLSLSLCFGFRNFIGTSMKSSFLKIFGTSVTPTTESITPTVYQKDLYAVLGVARNCTKSELRQAYMSIVFNNHPDKNNSEASLMLFRNASYAYQILGKDEKTRNEYDRKVNTEIYLNVLEDVGNDLIKPLAMDVAVPLINFTVNSITSFALPMIKNMYEQYEAVVKAAAASPGNDIDNDSFEDMVQRALNAMEVTIHNQTRRKLEEQLLKFDRTLNETMANLDESRRAEDEATKRVIELEANVESLSDTFESLLQ